MEEEPLLDPFRLSGTDPDRTLRVAILGFGTVGSAVARRLTTAAGVRGLALTCIFDRRAREKRDTLPSASTVRWTSRIDEILASDADIVIETLGGVHPAAEWIRHALLAGKSVVTANKQVIAHHGPALWRLAARQGRQLRFEAAVGGAMPIVRAIQDGLCGDRITRIVAILNGTTNAVLSRMEMEGCTLGDALADARARGFAESDPSADLDGVDAAAKLAILCALAFAIRVAPSQIALRSAGSVDLADFAEAARRNGTIRQLASAEYDERRSVLTAWVAPVVVPRTSLFAAARGAQNAAVITGAHSGELGIFGVGAGGDATSVPIISDAVAIARDPAAIVPAPVLASPKAVVGLETRLHAEAV